MDRGLQRRRHLRARHRRVQRPQRDLGRQPGRGHHRHPGHGHGHPRQPHLRHRHRHRRPGPGTGPHRHGHLHRLRPRRRHLRRRPRSSPAPPGPSPAARRPRPPPALHARRPRHLPLDRRLQRRRQLPGGHQRLQRRQRDVGRHPGARPPSPPRRPPTVTIGSPISDVATVTGAPAPAPAPTGTVTFTVFGPNDATCAGPADLHQRRPAPRRRPAAHGHVRPLHADRRRHLPVDRGLQRRRQLPGVSPARATPPTRRRSSPRRVATIATQATPTVTIGSPISDTATVTGGPAPAPAPTGTVSFTALRPQQRHLRRRPAIFTSNAQPLAGGPPPTATSADFTPTAPGSYRWIAAYSGDANYPGVTSACNDANETSVVTQAVATIATQATPTVTIGSPIRDVATVTGAPGPRSRPHRHGQLHRLRTRTTPPAPAPPSSPAPPGPSPAAPAHGHLGPLHARPPPVPTGGSPPTAATPTTRRSPARATTPTRRRWSPRPVATIATQATPTVTIGSPITDVATVTGAAGPGARRPPAPSRFTRLRPQRRHLHRRPPSSPAPPGPLAGGPPPTATSADFTPTAPGTYRWIAAYSGDANYPAVTSACNDANETSVVNQGVATVVTQATPNVTIGSPISDVATVTGGPAPAPRPPARSTSPSSAPTTPPAPAPPSSPAPTAAAGRRPAADGHLGPFTPTAPGTYRWIAAYSGDANYPAVTSVCNDANETSVVAQARGHHRHPGHADRHHRQPDLRRRHRHRRSGPGARRPPAPSTFTVFGPDDATCAGPVVFTSANRPLAGGPPPTATSGPVHAHRRPAPTGGSRPTAATPTTRPSPASATTPTRRRSSPRRWPTSSPRPRPSSPSAARSPTWPPSPAPPAPAPLPTGTVTFTLFGPDDPTCTSPPIFTSANRPLTGPPPAPPRSCRPRRTRSPRPPSAPTLGGRLQR